LILYEHLGFAELKDSNHSSKALNMSVFNKYFNSSIIKEQGMLCNNIFYEKLF